MVGEQSFDPIKGSNWSQEGIQITNIGGSEAYGQSNVSRLTATCDILMPFKTD